MDIEEIKIVEFYYITEKKYGHTYRRPCSEIKWEYLHATGSWEYIRDGISDKWNNKEIEDAFQKRLRSKWKN